jgi:phosphocarrier protein
LSVLALAVGNGEELVLAVEGDNAEAVADELAAMLASDLDAS